MSPGPDHVSRSRLPVMFLGDVFRSRSRSRPGPSPDHVSRFRSCLPVPIMSPGHVFGRCLPVMSTIPVTSRSWSRSCLPVPITSPRFRSRLPVPITSPGSDHVDHVSRLCFWAMSSGHVSPVSRSRLPVSRSRLPVSRSRSRLRVPITSPGSGDVWQVLGDVSRSCPHVPVMSPCHVSRFR